MKGTFDRPGFIRVAEGVLVAFGKGSRVFLSFKDIERLNSFVKTDLSASTSELRNRQERALRMFPAADLEAELDRRVWEDAETS